MAAIDPAKFKEDPRTSAELAKAILDHEFYPRIEGFRGSQGFPRFTVRERMLRDFHNMDRTHQNIGGVVFALKCIEDGIELHKTTQASFARALEVLQVYRNSDKDLLEENIDRIEPLVRTLASKLGIQLTEPGQQK